MPTNVLTDAQLKRLKPLEKPYKLFDGGGLHVYVTSTAKIWRLAYRIEGKAQTKSIGPYPLVSLAQARQQRDAMKSVLHAGGTLKREKAGARAVVPTLTDTCENYWKTREDLSRDYLMNATNALEKYVLTRFGALPINDFTREHVMQVLNGMNEAGRFVYLRKVRMWLAQVLDYAVEHKLVASNVADGIKTERAFGRRKVEHFAALELHDVGPFLKRIDLEADLDSVLAMELLMLTWMRTNEVRQLQVADLGTSPGITGKRLLIPAERMKRDKDLVVPLSTQALAVVERALLRNRGSNYVFPATHRIDRPLSENTVLALIARVGYKGRMTGHGWRTVASTWANERGYREDAIERQLAHVPEDEVRSTYNRAQYLDERKLMMQAWADWLDGERWA
jgi:integrase